MLFRKHRSSYAILKAKYDGLLAEHERVVANHLSATKELHALQLEVDALKARKWNSNEELRDMLDVANQLNENLVKEVKVWIERTKAAKEAALSHQKTAQRLQREKIEALYRLPVRYGQTGD